MGQPKRSERGLNPGRCPVTATMTVIAPKWAAEIWKQLAAGPRRTEDLRRAIPGISRKMLVEQLRAFEAEGIVVRTVHPTVPPQVQYVLSPHGHSMLPVWRAIAVWGRRHLGLHRRSSRRPRARPQRPTRAPATTS